MADQVPLCALCSRQIAGEASADKVKLVEKPHECCLCFGILHPDFVHQVSEEANRLFASQQYDSNTFILALSLPVSQTLRETLILKRYPEFNGILHTVPFKIRNVNTYIDKLGDVSNIRPTLASDLQLLIAFESDEFNASDLAFCRRHFPNEVRPPRKRKFHHQNGDSEQEPIEVSRSQLQQINNRITKDIAEKYSFVSSSRPCTYKLSLERDPIYIAGRYMKFSRTLPQSPWTVDEDKNAQPEPGNSVSEKIRNALEKEFGASELRFNTSGREDIDVRMLGEGRPFCVEMRDCKRTKQLRGVEYIETLQKLEDEMNRTMKDVKVRELTRVKREEAEKMAVGADEKRKWYSAHCYSTLPLTDEAICKALQAIPVQLIQKTPIRVLKRRSLLDRPRTIYSMDILRQDSNHFLLRLETQAGTYVKEFVHGDFGRTRPSLANLLGVENGEVDILELDVEKVDQMTVTVLMVAEKPMLAESIAKLLSDNQANKRKGWNGACSVSEYMGSFMGQNARFKVTSTCGHVMTTDFPPKFNNWDRTDPTELYSSPTVKIEANPKLKMVDYLASEAKAADYLVLWLDCDKEGENICFEVVDAVRNSMKRPTNGDFMDVVYRAHFSAITEKDIKAAMRNLGRPDINMSLSVDARQELDLRVGCSFTRFQTKYFQGKYGDLDSTVISYGPCQTPTLGFCVTRHDQIVQFKPEPYWVLQTTFTTTNGEEIRPEWERGRIFDREVAQLFLERIKKAKTATVVEITKKEGRKEKPMALNTVELMRVASSSLGLSPQTTMTVAEHLYVSGYISYPRTETTSYPANFDLVGTLRMQANDSKWGHIARNVLEQGIQKPKKGEDKGDHPPITPMKPNNGQLSGDSARVYDYVTQHFIATLMGPCIYEITTVRLQCGEEELTLQGRNTIVPGFTEIMTWLAVEDERRMPNFKRGDTLTLKEAELADRETSPPSYLTEAELISLMEKHGIGTDASIPVHINTICQRNYVTVESGRRLIPTKLGISLVHGYLRVDRELVLPTMRSEVETQLNLIAKGQADYLAVKNHALEMFRLKFVYFVKNIPLVDTLFEASFTTLSEAGKPFSRCGKCHRFMKLVEAKPQRLFCPACQDTYNLPSFKDGVVRTYGDRKCPLDEFDLVYWQGPGGKLSRSFALCPFCYNNPPFEGMRNGDGCDKCSHPACPHSFMKNGVCGCLMECGGVLVLDPMSHPKWRLSCNRCSSVVGLFEGALKVKVTDKSCEECNSQFVSVDYKDKSPLPEGKTSFKGCIFCDQAVKECINLNHAYLNEEARQKSIQSGRGRGRGRGRGGPRGRGNRGRGR